MPVSSRHRAAASGSIFAPTPRAGRARARSRVARLHLGGEGHASDGHPERRSWCNIFFGLPSPGCQAGDFAKPAALARMPLARMPPARHGDGRPPWNGRIGMETMSRDQEAFDSSAFALVFAGFFAFDVVAGLAARRASAAALRRARLAS